ncbi:uncharacterized protein LOC129599814 [Paramacrobiotus metropolitanus]|uniref:uncharacterized protein LOC129599814 n=1 Tax=Paramacrobiotus metropolitanus TaxID=2943436 RepID=UPI002445D510|nr:uncharacterized protein LOC129599814 [Paramacrobiotus metropolitanus]
MTSKRGRAALESSSEESDSSSESETSCNGELSSSSSSANNGSNSASSTPCSNRSSNSGSPSSPKHPQASSSKTGTANIAVRLRDVILGEMAYGMFRDGEMSEWRKCQIVSGSNPRCIGRSASYLVQFSGPSKLRRWISNTLLLPYTKATQDRVEKYNALQRTKRLGAVGGIVDDEESNSEWTSSSGESDEEVLPARQPAVSKTNARKNVDGKLPPIRIPKPVEARATRQKGAQNADTVHSDTNKPQKSARSSVTANKRQKENVPVKNSVCKDSQAKERRFLFVPVPDGSSPGVDQILVKDFSARDVQLSVMHENAVKTIVFVAGLRKISVPTYGLDNDGNVTLRTCRVSFPYAAAQVSEGVSGTYLIVSVCKKPSILPAAEYHPKCFRAFLNDKMLHVMIPDGKSPYPHVPLEVPLSALKTENTLIISWTESNVEDVAMDYCLHVYLAKRKAVSTIVAKIKTNVLSVAHSLAQESIRGSSREEEDSDEDVTSGIRTLKLSCPISKQRIVVPVRGLGCRHLECFDAASYLSLNVGPKARFLCPLCAKIVLPRDLVVDEFFDAILSFTEKERVELVGDRKGITIREQILKSTIVDLTKDATGFITIDERMDGTVIVID